MRAILPDRPMTSTGRNKDPSWPLRTERIATRIGELRIQVPRDVGRLLTKSSSLLRAAERFEHPHWAEVWPASVALARAVLRGPSLAGVTVVDLGCGAGLAGVAAARHGARVVFADRAPEALTLADHNARRNGVLDHEIRAFDWERDDLPASTRLLLLADLCYSWRAVRPLLRQVDMVIGHGGAVLAADPFRPTANDLWRGLIDRGATPSTLPITLRENRCEVRIAALNPVEDRSHSHGMKGPT